MTKQRRIIFQIIQNAMQHHEHLTSEQIFLLAKQEIPNLAVGTVYRNLNLMVLAGEIRKVSVANAPDLFEGNISKHDHCICAKCGNLSDIKIEGLDTILEQQTGGKMLSFELSIHYICPSCLKTI